MRLVRYIHLNPVRANLIKTPQDFQWSSYCTYLARNEITWLTQSKVLKKFGTMTLEARYELAKYTTKSGDAELDISLIHRSNQLGALGSEEFVEQISDSLPAPNIVKAVKLTDLITIASTNFQINYTELQSASREKKIVDVRSILSLAAKKTQGINLTELAQFFNRDSSSLYRSIARATKSPELYKKAEWLLEIASLKTLEND